MLRPLTRWLNEYPRLPLPVAALFVILAAVAVITGIAYLISVPSDALAARAPESLAIAKERLAFLAAPISYLQEALYNIENIGAAASAVPQVVVARGDALPGILLFGTASTLRDLFVTLLILYFMLASGDRMLRALIEVLPRFADKWRAVEIAGEIQASIASYLLTIFLMNAVVGILVGIAMALCGMGHPTLWGAIAFLLNSSHQWPADRGSRYFLWPASSRWLGRFRRSRPRYVKHLSTSSRGRCSRLIWSRADRTQPRSGNSQSTLLGRDLGIPGALLAVPLLAIIRYSPTVSTRSRASEISLARDETPSAFRSNSIFFGDGLEVILGESHVFGGV